MIKYLCPPKVESEASMLENNSVVTANSCAKEEGKCIRNGVGTFNQLLAQAQSIISGTLFALFLVLAIPAFSQVEQPVNTTVDYNRELVNQHYNGLLWFARSAEMEALFLQAYEYAAIKLKANLKIAKGKPAVILDLDETVLDNSPYEVERILEGIPYSSKTWKEWTAKGEAKLLPGALKFLQLADSLGADIFYISNRKQVEMDGTLKNLIELNVPNADTSHVFLRTDKSDKTERRARVTAHHDVILYIGDNLTDFSSVFADRDSSDLGSSMVIEMEDELRNRFIMLPNPMYGEWEKALYGNTYRMSSEEKLKMRQKALSK